jgi:alkylhydroperoxidase family enzyme
VGDRTWLAGAAEASPDALLALRPDLDGRYAALVDAAWRSGVDPVLLELCRLRIASVLGDAAGASARQPQALLAGLNEQLVVHLDEWWAHPSFGSAERAALAVAEQFAIDVHGVDDAQFGAVAAHLGPDGAVAFAMALALFDGQSRLRRAFAVASDHGGAR